MHARLNQRTDTCIPMNDESQYVSGKLDCGLFVRFYVMVFLGLDCFCFLSIVVPVEPLSGALTYSLLLLSFFLIIMMTDACTNKHTAREIMISLQGGGIYQSSGFLSLTKCTFNDNKKVCDAHAYNFVV